jgi:hypothetical protein
VYVGETSCGQPWTARAFEIPFRALVKDHYQNMRANVLYSRLDARGRGRVQIAAELPIMFAQGRRPEPPKIKFPAAADLTGEPKRMRQSKLEASPYLQSLPVYRYRN